MNWRAMSWTRKAVTVLMLTVLLVSFAVAVSSVVMNLSRAQVEATAECAINVNLHFAPLPETGPPGQPCYDGEKKLLPFTVENGLNVNVEGLIVSVVGTEQAETFELAQAKMGKAEIYQARVPFDRSASGEIRQVRIVPAIQHQGEELLCREQALVVEGIEEC